MVDPSRIYQADDARGVLLVANEKKTLTSVGSPGNVAVGGPGRLLGLEVVGEKLALEGVGAEEEELLAGDEVPEWGVRLAKMASGVG